MKKLIILILIVNLYCEELPYIMCDKTGEKNYATFEGKQYANMEDAIYAYKVFANNRKLINGVNMKIMDESLVEYAIELGARFTFETRGIRPHYVLEIIGGNGFEINKAKEFEIKQEIPLKAMELFGVPKHTIDRLRSNVNAQQGVAPEPVTHQ